MAMVYHKDPEHAYNYSLTCQLPEGHQGPHFSLIPDTYGRSGYNWMNLNDFSNKMKRMDETYSAVEGIKQRLTYIEIFLGSWNKSYASEIDDDEDGD